MNSCPVVELGRRRFLRGGATAAAATVASGVIPRYADATPALARISYPSAKLVNLRDLKTDDPVQIQYPDKDSPGVIIKLAVRSRVASGRTATLSRSRRCARTRATRSAMPPPIRHSTARGTTRGSTAKREASRFGATPRKTCRNSGCASPAMGTFSRRGRTS
jgi:hypothetical protein